MKNLIIIFLILFSSTLYSQFHIGTSAAYDLENEYSKLGVGINYMLTPKVTLGGGLMITPFDVDDDYEIMLNVKYDLGRFDIAAGYMSTKCQTTTWECIWVQCTVQVKITTNHMLE